MNFAELGLAPALLRAVEEKGYTSPSPIQAQAIPAVLGGGDLMAAAQTGTGKTAGFTLPLLQRLAAGRHARPGHCRALVLTPTRELAAQVYESVLTYGKYVDVTAAVVFGGVNIKPQMAALRQGVDILVATPGRLLDLYQQHSVRFQGLEVLVLDEADRMLDMGFIRDIRKILALLPAERQNLLFSATFSTDIRALAKGLLRSPREIDVAPKVTTAETVDHKLHPVEQKQKTALLIHLITANNWHQALVFSRTKHGANKIAAQLEKANISAAAIHGNKSQNQRTRALADFKAGKVQILVATDIAARGIDIDQLPQVVNYDLPNVPEDYVHRIGRTGRAGARGRAISLVSSDERKQLRDIERFIRSRIDQEVVKDFVPPPVSSEPDTRPAAPERPARRPGQGQGRSGGQSSNGRSGGQSTNGRSGGQSTNGRSGGQSTNGRSGGQSTNGRRRGGQPGNSRSAAPTGGQRRGRPSAD